MKRIVVIGGGIAGLCSAYYLNKSGHRVTVLDMGRFDDGCSYGNAGMVVPSHFIPLAAPGMISKGIRWMFNPRSPFFIRPRFRSELIRWGYQFYRHSTVSHVERAIPVLREISLLSKQLYRALASEMDFGFAERGLLMYFQTHEAQEEERESARIANREGIEARLLSADEIKTLEPDVQVSARGAVYFPGDSHLNPRTLMNCLVARLKANGVDVFSGEEVVEFVRKKNEVTKVRTRDKSIELDEVVVASGAWSPSLLTLLRVYLPLQAGKGYSFTTPFSKAPIRIPSILTEARVAITPMNDFVRFGGTMEITGLDHRINMNRVRGIVASIPRYYPELHVEVPSADRVWHGLRPCSPDGLPYIGRLRSFRNVIVATGHSMMGISLGPATGLLVSEIANESIRSMDTALFNPSRFE